MYSGIQDCLNASVVSGNEKEVQDILDEISALKVAEPETPAQPAPPRPQVRNDLYSGLPPPPNYGSPTGVLQPPQDEMRMRQQALYQGSYLGYNNEAQRRSMLREIQEMQRRLRESGDQVAIPVLDEMSEFNRVLDAYELVKSVFDQRQGVETAIVVIEALTGIAGYVFDGKRTIAGHKTINLSTWGSRLDLRKKRLHEQLHNCGPIVTKLSSAAPLGLLVTLGFSAFEAVKEGNTSSVDTADEFWKSVNAINNS